MENKEAGRAAKRLAAAAKGLRKAEKSDPEGRAFKQALNHLRTNEIHYARKENQLFQALERKRFSAPSKVMWGKHNEIRDAFKAVTASFDKGDYPTAARKLFEAEWAVMAKGEAEIGYAWVKPAEFRDPGLVRREPSAFSGWTPPPESVGAADESLKLDEGRLYPWQVNAMMKVLPIDVTFVDENDRVAYYSAGTHRVFPRSPNVIGREVQNCHPPKSLNAVNVILKDFRD